MDVLLDSSGGFAGDGYLDCLLVDGEMTASRPFHSPSECTAILTAAQRGSIEAAAARVGWPGLAASYMPPENPSCCCDQFLYEIDVDLFPCGGASESHRTRWCDQSVSEGLLPADLTDFVEALTLVCEAVLGSC